MENKDTSKKHFQVSLLKSANRIVAGIFFMTGEIFLAGMFLIIAEALGIVEEL